MVSELLSSLARSIAEIETVVVVAFVLAAIALCIATYFIVRMSLGFYRLYGRHEVVCPDNGKPAVIQIRAMRGALTSVLEDPDVFVRTCTRWPEKNGCAQGCLESVLRSRER
jgi:hypothetical protein